ncbi:MAG: hypothetical protein U0S48_08890 [Solirubrobacteraceae bacterium]
MDVVELAQQVDETPTGSDGLEHPPGHALDVVGAGVGAPHRSRRRERRGGDVEHVRGTVHAPRGVQPELGGRDRGALVRRQRRVQGERPQPAEHDRVDVGLVARGERPLDHRVVEDVDVVVDGDRHLRVGVRTERGDDGVAAVAGVADLNGDARVVQAGPGRRAVHRDRLRDRARDRLPDRQLGG